MRRTFDYRCPASIDPARVQPGTRLWVPFGRRRLVGILLEYRDRSEVPADKLKPAIDVVDTEPTFDSTLLQFLRWSADYYRHPIGEVLAAARQARCATVQRYAKSTHSGERRRKVTTAA